MKYAVIRRGAFGLDESFCEGYKSPNGGQNHKHMEKKSGIRESTVENMLSVMIRYHKMSSIVSHTT